MDLSQSIVPKSDQLNADDLMGGPRTFTITEVSPGNTEQPVNVELADSRPFRPSKSMLRVMVAAWGLDGKEWTGHRVTLYRDPKVKWAGQEVGGIRISHMTGIDKQLRIALTETKGKRTPFVVDPLPDAPQTPPEPTAEAVTACTGVDELKVMWRSSGPERRAQIEARVTELNAPTEPTTDEPADSPWATGERA